MYFRLRVLILLLAIYAVFFVSAASLAQLSPRPNRITQEVTSGAMVAMAGTVHPLTRRATDLGAVNSAMQLDSMTLNIALSAAQQTELDGLLAAQQNPQSPLYHQWLTQEEYGARFGLADSDLGKVTGWLTAQGFTVNRISKSRNAISFGGKAWQVESAFHTQLHQYKLNGEMHFANATELKVPAGLASVLLNVRGLNNFRLKPLAKIKVEPQYTLDSTDHFLTPGDWATIYDVTPIYNAGHDGTGAHIGVVGQTYVPQADIDHFRSASGLTATKLSPYCISSADCTDTAGISTTGDLGEADLDIEWAGGIARNATVDYIYASAADQTLGVFDALQYAVQYYTIPGTGTVLPVISMSYTDCEETLTAYPSDVTWVTEIGQQANSQGQTIVVASGDSGAAGCDSQGEPADYPAQDGESVSVPPDSPNFTGVGGTTLNGDESNYGLYWNQTPGMVNSALSYIPETVWNDTSASNGLLASTGGVSLYFPQPNWQPTPPNYTGVSGRFVPDVSFAASPMHDGYMNCSQDYNSTIYGTMCADGFFSSGSGGNSVFFVAGGTSASTPSFAGILTLLAQKYGPLGNVNPTLYNLALTHPSVFHDITSGNNIVPCTLVSVLSSDIGCTTGSFGWDAQTGYDLATGLGSVDGYALYTNWQITPTVTWPAPSAITYGTALSSAQLDATASMPGTFVYTPPAGSVLPAGTQELSVTFTPTETADYTTATQTVFLTVNQATQTITFPNPGTQIFGEAPITLTAIATSGLPVSYTVTSGPATITSSTLTITGTGSVTVLATQSGNADYAAATPVSDTFTVSQGTPPATSALLFVPMTPCRLVDTRNALGPFGGPSITGNTSRSFAIPNSACGVPSTAAAYSLNVTAVPQAGLGYMTVWPTGVTQPLVSLLNSDGRVKANAAIVPAGISGLINVYATDTTDVVLDINGYFLPTTSTTALAFYPLTPCRVADTRNPTAPLGGPSLVAMQTRAFPIQSSACNIPSSAQAYSLNLTAVPQDGLGYLSAWPTEQAWPGVSTLNVSPSNPVVANAAIVPAGPDGGINVLGSSNTDVVIDINGYFAPVGAATGGQALFTVTPCRVLDTRSSSGAFNGMLPVNVTSSSCGIPSTAEAFVLNATVVPTGGLGYLTLWPENEARPVVSTLNADDGVIASNMAIVPTTNGSIDAFSSSSTQLILDISGYFAPSSSGSPALRVSAKSAASSGDSVVLRTLPASDQVGITQSVDANGSATEVCTSDSGTLFG